MKRKLVIPAVIGVISGSAFYFIMKYIKWKNIAFTYHKCRVYERYIKRRLDFGCALVVAVLLSPVILIIALLVRFKLGSPIIFKQERPGLNENIFTLYKFRTMTDKKDINGKLLPDELRITKFGKFLRTTSLDELPELWNIIKGDMSIIGPRPLLVKYLQYYTMEEKHRHDVRPGLTGLAQINGRNSLTWDKRFKFDLKYVENISLKLDIYILTKTIEKVLKKEDILVGDEQIILDLDEERERRNAIT